MVKPVKMLSQPEESRCDCTALRKASRRISQLYDMALAPAGLKTTQRAILAQVGRFGSTSIGRLAAALVMDSGALAHTLKPLERDGLVAINVDPNDRRNRLVTLTAAGRSCLTESTPLLARVQHAFEVALGKVESAELRNAMRFLVSEEFSDGFIRALESSAIYRRH
jgi:DNA-binding MarR family transcriptional regulator